MPRIYYLMIKKMKAIEGGRELEEEKGGKERQRKEEEEWRKMGKISGRSLAKGRR